jgi:hypothetical protein
MNLNRDEFLLLARTGRDPHRTRAGPGPDERFEADLGTRRVRRVRRRGGPALRAGVGGGLRHLLGSRSGPSSRATRMLGEMDEQTYFELEFAVGFPAEEETLL